MLGIGNVFGGKGNLLDPAGWGGGSRLCRFIAWEDLRWNA